LLVGQDIGLDIGDAKASGDCLGGHAVVAGQHDDMDARCIESFQCIGRGDLDRIGDADRTGHLPSTPTKIAVAPSERRWSACAARDSTAIPCSSRKRALPATSLRPSTVPVIPLPTG
jgi:hypothetical protein